MDKLSYQDAARILNTSVQSLRNKVSSQGITLAKQGNRAYFTREQIEQLQPMESEEIKIFLELTRNEADALHQFCAKGCQESDEGTREAFRKLVEALAEVKP